MTITKFIFLKQTFPIKEKVQMEIINKNQTKNPKGIPQFCTEDISQSREEQSIKDHAICPRRIQPNQSQETVSFYIFYLESQGDIIKTKIKFQRTEL